MSLLDATNVTKHYVETGLLGGVRRRVRALDGASLRVERGETVGIVGESGAGKSTFARVVAGITPPTEGRVRLDGAPVTDADRRRVGFVFQDPTGSLDPRMSAAASVAEPLRIAGTERRVSRERALSMLERVGVESPDAHPHELSGGQCQRVALARALVTDPDFLVLDEPTSALDVSVQASVLSLLDELRREFGLAVLFVSHDLRVVRAVSDRAAVMYAGEIVERGGVESLFDAPAHPYTRALLDADPTVAFDSGAGPAGDGEPDPEDPPAGCRFHPRCPEIALPDGYEGDRDAFRAVLGFRRALAAGDVRDVPPEALRERHGLPPDGLPERARRCLDAALDRTSDGDDDAAAALLGRVFETPCERTSPDLRGEDHEAACLRVDTDAESDSGPDLG